MEFQGMKIGDVFSTGKHLRAKVVDFVEKRSLTTGEVLGHIVIAQGLGMATNRFETIRTSVMRNLITTTEGK